MNSEQINLVCIDNKYFDIDKLDEDKRNSLLNYAKNLNNKEYKEKLNKRGIN